MREQEGTGTNVTSVTISLLFGQETDTAFVGIAGLFGRAGGIGSRPKFQGVRPALYGAEGVDFGGIGFVGTNIQSAVVGNHRLGALNIGSTRDSDGAWCSIRYFSPGGTAVVTVNLGVAAAGGFVSTGIQTTI